MARRRFRRFKKRRGKKSLTTKVNSVVRKVTQMINQTEHKNNAFSVGTLQTATNALQVFDISDVAEGDDYNQRTGHKIKPTGLRVKFIFRGSDNDVGPQPFRVLIVQDLCYDGTDRTLANIFDPSAAAGSYTNFMSTYNDDYVNMKSRKSVDQPLKILYDSGVHFLESRYAAAAPGTTWKRDQGSMPQLKVLTIHIPGSKMKEITYSSTTAASVKAGRISAYFLTGVSATAADNNNYLYNYNLTYIDL